MQAIYALTSLGSLVDDYQFVFSVRPHAVFFSVTVHEWLALIPAETLKLAAEVFNV